MPGQSAVLRGDREAELLEGYTLVFICPQSLFIGGLINHLLLPVLSEPTVHLVQKPCVRAWRNFKSWHLPPPFTFACMMNVMITFWNMV
jgi:hypothetical protein